jgi:ATP-binding cassette, subfamily B, bacterial PglK
LIGLMLVGMLLEMLSIGLVIPALALLTDPEATARYRLVQSLVLTFGSPSREALIVWGMCALVGVFLIKNAFLAFLAWHQIRFPFRLNVGLGQRLFTAYLSRPFTFHLQRNSAELINTISAEASMFAFTGVGAALKLITEVVVLVGLGTLLLILEPLGTITVAGLGCLAAWAFLRFMRPRTKRWASSLQHHGEMSSRHLHQGLGAAKEVILLGRDKDFLQQFQWHRERSADAGERHELVQQFPRLALELFGIAALAALTILMLARGRSTVTVVPMVGLFAVVAFRVLPSINRIVHSVQSIRYAMPFVDRLYTDLVTENTGFTAVPTDRKIAFTRSLELVDVTYCYPDAPRSSLNGVSLAIQRGESVGVVGPSGAGKSTLIDVILGLLTPTKGQVVVDGNDIQHDLRGWQNQVGYVPQVIYLTDDTLRRNIAFGLPEDRIDDEHVWLAVQAAQLEAFVRALPSGLETVVGERGIRISGGERQRVGIARALYHDPGVLVLDEATSSLDRDTEHGIIATLRDLQRAKTVVIVSHRLTTIEHCDRVYELRDGKVSERTATTTNHLGELR